MKVDQLIRGVHLATFDTREGYGEILDGAVLAHDGRILWVGKEKDLPSGIETPQDFDGEGGWLTPGLIDCHTHLIWAGSRTHELEQRLCGVSYEEIARAGGGIVSTVRATRALDEYQLADVAEPRLRDLMSEGVTTVEMKSGYGLDTATELRLLQVAADLGRDNRIRVRKTFLGAHALPPEFAGRADDYITEICANMLPALVAEGLVDAVDAFCEHIGFSLEQTKRVFNAANLQGLRVKLHAEQLSNMRGAAMAAAFRALSADHLEWVDEQGIEAMRDAHTAAVLLPGAFYFLRETRVPPIDLLRRYEIPMAIATDCNPGTSPLTSLLLAMNMAATLFRMTVDECLIGVTRAAAQALGLARRVGTLEADKQCDLAIWNVERPAELVYAMGRNPLHARVWKGE
jgi:imidazolonepropionase